MPDPTPTDDAGARAVPVAERWHTEPVSEADKALADEVPADEDVPDGDGTDDVVLLEEGPADG